ncbi:MAG: hypothetical protein JXN65_06430 [Clostridia bacterium]|nr:hypothetical protein [Clostridia bacterium]
MNIEKLFLLALNMSLTAGYVVLAVFVIRGFMNKSARWIMGILWLAVFLRLLMPFSFKSDFSIFAAIPNADINSTQILFSDTPEMHSGVPYLNSMINPALEKGLQTEAGITALEVMAAIWLLGFIAILIYSIVSYILLKKRLSTAVLYSDNVYISEKIKSPFVLGFFKPRVYIPFGLTEESLKNVLLHENAHISRRDYIVKPLTFLLSAMHWFNPFIWAAYILLSKDIEMACDEKAIKNMKDEERKKYSETLLSLSISKASIALCPIAFGEVSVKQRVKSALSYKKPSFWIIVAAFIITTAAITALIANPIKEKEDTIKTIEDLYGTYYPNEVIYVNPLSSFYPFDLSKGPYYEIDENMFAVVKMENDEKIYSTTPDYLISEISEEEFINMFFMELQIGMPDITEYNTISKVEISDRYTLFIMDSELWVAEMNGDYLWLIYRLGTERAMGDILQSYYKGRLTIDAVESLVEEKGENLTWSDFENYECSVTGSGLFILNYPIDDGLSVLIGGSGQEEVPMYIFLVKNFGDDTEERRMELRDQGIDIQRFMDDTDSISTQNIWAFTPFLSSVFPALPIMTDIDYSEINVTIDTGVLYIHGNGKTENKGREHAYKPDEIIYWSPIGEDSGANYKDTSDTCWILLEVKDENGIIAAKIEIKVTKISEDEISGTAQYEVTLTKSFDSSDFVLNLDTDSYIFVLSVK